MGRQVALGLLRRGATGAAVDLDEQGLATTAEKAAARIIDGIAKDRFRVLVGTDARVLDILSRISARRTTRFVGKQIKSVL